jgi:hypothetical protein
MKHRGSVFHLTNMRQRRVNSVSEPAESSLPRILAAFVIGMVATFAAALMYSSLQQRLRSVGAIKPFVSGRIAVPAKHLAPDQEAAENSTAGQQRTAPTDGSTHEPPTLPDLLSKDQATSQMLRTSLGSGGVGTEIRPERVHTTIPQALTRIPPPTPNTAKPYTIERQVGPLVQVHDEPQPGPAQPVQYPPYANMPTAPQTGSAVVARNAPLVLSKQNGDPVPPRTGPPVLTVQPGTRLPVRLVEALSSDRDRAGETFRAGASVFGRIANVSKAPLLGGRADLSLTLTDITTADGHLAKIETDNVEQLGARSGIVNTAKMATGAAMGAVTGTAELAGIRLPARNDTQSSGFLATKRTVVFPAGTLVVFSLATALKVTQ